MNPLTETCLRYLDGDLTESEAVEFDRLIAQSPEAARELALHLIDEHYFTKTQAAATDHQIDHKDASDASALNLAVRHLERFEESDRVLRDLLRMEREATTLPRYLEEGASGKAAGHEKIDGLTWGEVYNATAYLLSRMPKPVVKKWLAAAAAILLAATVVVALIVFSIAGTTPTRELVQGPADGNGPLPAAPVVATLSASHDATWAEGALSPGSQLRAGDKLTLTQGFAEITTNHGAVAMIQAPATIELLNNDNAIHLYQGKLVGLCETDASKGFLVSTPHLDITDLGTRFGVDATRADTTEVQVFQGEVQLARPGLEATDRQRVLTSGQAIIVHSDSRPFQAVPLDPNRFIAFEPYTDRYLVVATNVPGIQAFSGDLQATTADQFVGKDQDQWPTTSNACVFRDFSGRLGADVLVNVAGAGDFRDAPKDLPTTISAGTSVDSYIILKTSGSSSEMVKVAGKIIFDHEVIGVITEQETASTFVKATADTSAVFAYELAENNWIEHYSFEEGFTISEDRKTLIFQFQVNQAHDTIRVLVKAQEDK